MDRRNFIKQVLLYSAGLSVSVPGITISEVCASTHDKPDLVKVSGDNFKEITIKALESLGGMSNFVKRGDRVVIKPNIGWDRKPALAANTHPVVVQSLIEMALDSGASKVLLFDHTCNEKRRCYISSGMAAMVKSIGSKKVKLQHIDKRKFVPVDIKKGKSLQRWDIYEDALTADCYINVPVAKHHGLGGLTLGLKNSMGVIGGNRGRLHFDLGQKLADLATVVKPQLTVIDATRILLRNGPQGGRLEDVKITNTVIASQDPVAADAYGTTLFGLIPNELESTVAAYEMGLGQMNITDINVIEHTL